MKASALFEEIMNQHKDKLYRICYAYLYDKNHVEDLFQEILINIWNSLPSFRRESQLTTWMYRIAVNTAITFNKKEKRHKNLFSGRDMPEKAESNAGKSEKIEREQQLNALHTCIHQLPSEERLLMGLLLEDVPYKEIADISGLTVNHVGVKINRIKKKISKMLNEQGYGV